MAVKPNAEDKVVDPTTYMAELKPPESGFTAEAKAELPFKEKVGSVFPARRRSVKRLILDLILQLFSASEPETCNVKTPRPTRAANVNRVHPYSPERGGCLN